MYLQRNIAGRIDVRSDFQYHAHGFVSETLVQGSYVCVLTLRDEWYLLADEQLAHLVVAHIHLRRSQHSRMRRLMQELDKKIHADRIIQRPRAQTGQCTCDGVASATRRVVGRRLSAKSLY